MALFPHHDWADADGLESPDPALAATGYFHHDPDSHSRRLRRCHEVLWSKKLPDGRGLSLRPDGSGLRDTDTNEYLSSDAAIPAWEQWSEVQSFHAETQHRLQDAGRGTVHDLGWRLYDMGGFVLFPGCQVDGRWTINQAKGCIRSIADRLDLALECIRLYYAFLRERTEETVSLPDGYDRVNPLGSVLHRYRRFFEVFGSFEGYVNFWLLDDLVSEGESGLQVNFLLPRSSSGPYDFSLEAALPVDGDEYCAYLIAADDFVDKRNRRMAQELAPLRPGNDICPACLGCGGKEHRRGWR